MSHQPSPRTGREGAATEDRTGKGWVVGFARLMDDRGLAAVVMGREEGAGPFCTEGHSAPSWQKTVGNQTRRFSHTLGTASAETGGQDQFESHTE